MHDSPESGEWLALAHKDLVRRYQAYFYHFNIKIGPGNEVNGLYFMGLNYMPPFCGKGMLKTINIKHKLVFLQLNYC